MMKRLIPIICLPFLLYVQGVHADIDSGIFGSEEMADLEKEASRPFNVTFSFDGVGKSHFTDRPLKCQSQSFSEATAEVGAVFYYNKRCDEGAKATVGYSYATFDWKQNPFFRQKHFNYISFELGASTKRIRGWLWQANVSMNVDSENFKNVQDYANYDLLLWGRYNINSRFGYHVGFLGFTGMHVNKVWPIFGFDWIISRKWKLNAVYPINISLVYNVTKRLTASLAGRAFFNRYRLDRKELLSQGVFEYRNTGAEFALNYDYCSRLKANVHAGYTFGGQVRFSDRNYQHGRYILIDGAPYVGGNLTFSF